MTLFLDLNLSLRFGDEAVLSVNIRGVCVRRPDER